MLFKAKKKKAIWGEGKKGSLSMELEKSSYVLCISVPKNNSAPRTQLPIILENINLRT